ncbi:MAG: hypothetical protein J6S85_11100 [Methanobrevibacter sp.]|nr:hypothetical protein [Methanobrevibacter sp.]
MSLHLGNSKIKDLYLGSTKIKDGFLGAIKIFASSISYIVNLNYQWKETTEYNFGPEYRVFKSNSNYNVNNGTASMFLQSIENKNEDLIVKYYASSEPSYDKLYIESSTNNGSSYTTNATDNGTNNTSAPATLSNYKTYTYTISALASITNLRFRYAKDGSQSKGLDRGFIVLPSKCIRGVIGA